MGDLGGEQLSNVQPEETSRRAIGSSCSVKKLYDGGLDEHAYQVWLAEMPEERIDLNTTPDAFEHAVVIRHRKTSVPNQQRVEELIIRSTYMQKLLKPHVLDFDSAYKDDESGYVFSHPFMPLFFARQDIYDALARESEDGSGENHAALLLEVLKDILRPVSKKYDVLLATAEITFELLWTLYQPHTKIIDEEKNTELISKCRGSGYERGSQGRETGLRVDSQYITWDGTNFGWTAQSVRIERFDGRRSISGLKTYPLRFHPASLSHASTTAARNGRLFATLACKEPHMMTYRGSYSVSNTSAQSWWKPKKISKVSERVMLDTAAYGRYNSGVSITPLMSREEMLAALDLADEDVKNEDVFIYCYPLLKAFGLQSKIWVEFHVSHLSDVVWNTEAWPSLVLPPGPKQLVHAFTKAFLETDDQFDDFVAGKSQAMLMLLCGQPGTGKTLTAEGVAEELRKPLYAVSASELGTDASKVEGALDRIFDLCARWDAVVLLDEADVFLRSRQSESLARNEIVSVFLRKLEYLAGICFLTTNRLGDFDEAFESRIHVTVKFDDLSAEARKTVWKRFLASAEDNTKEGVEVSEEEVGELSELPLNGREIRNMVKSGLLIAWDAKSPLKKEHIDLSNNLEQMPLFVAAVLASIMAEKVTLKGAGTGEDVTGLWKFLAGWFAIRSLYVVAYVQITTHKTSLLRSVVYTMGSFLAFWQIYKAASVLG